MDANLSAIELNGAVDEHGKLNLDQRLPIVGPRRVRVIVLYAADDELDENAWLQLASVNPAFKELKDSAEDIYSVDDGKPIE